MSETIFYLIAFLITGISSLSLLVYGVRHGRMLELFAALILGVLAVSFFQSGELVHSVPAYFSQMWSEIKSFFENFPERFSYFIEQMKQWYDSSQSSSSES
jgi:hypothetical protein